MFRVLNTCLVGVLAWFTVAGMAAAQNDDDLPAAPSAVLKPKAAPPPAPAPPKFDDPAPADTSASKPETQPANDQKANISDNSKVSSPAKYETTDEGRP